MVIDRRETQLLTRDRDRITIGYFFNVCTRCENYYIFVSVSLRSTLYTLRGELKFIETPSVDRSYLRIFRAVKGNVFRNGIFVACKSFDVFVAVLFSERILKHFKNIYTVLCTRFRNIVNSLL